MCYFLSRTNEWIGTEKGEKVVNRDFLSAYALRNGKIVHIDSVENGLGCNCVCPSCNTRMIARQGEQRIHHFAHYNAIPCKTGYQTAVHMRAKEILSELKYIVLPSYEFLWHCKKFRVPPMTVKISDVVLEKRIDDIIPDVIVITDKGKRILVEIYVTHKIGDEKLAKIKHLDIPTIEIDLSRYELDDALLTDAMTKRIDECGKWVYYGREGFFKTKIWSFVSELHIEKDGSVDCPLMYDASADKQNPQKGYAKECTLGQNCKFYLGESRDCVYCLGKKYFADLQDMERPEETQREDYLQKLDISDAMKKVRSSIRRFAALPSEKRKGKQHPLNMLRVQYICSIEIVKDTGVIVPRMKVTGINMDGQLVAFYVNVMDTDESKQLWKRKWYKDFVLRQGEMVVWYEEILSYKDYEDQETITAFVFSSLCGGKNLPAESLYYISERKWQLTWSILAPSVGRRKQSWLWDTPSNEKKELSAASFFAALEQKNFVVAGSKQYADCHHLFRAEDLDHSFVQKGICLRCPRYQEGIKGIDFFCTSNPNLENKKKYELLKRLQVKYLTDAQEKALGNQLRESGVVADGETFSFLDVCS